MLGSALATAYLAQIGPEGINSTFAHSDMIVDVATAAQQRRPIPTLVPT